VPSGAQFSSAPAGEIALDSGAKLSVDPIGNDGNGLVVATFTEGQQGRQVYLQRQSGSAWETVATAVQDKAGKAEFAAASGVNTYRAVAAAYGAGGTVKDAVATAALPVDQQWHTLIADDFNGSSLDSKLWSNRLPGIYLDPRKCSAATPAMSSVKDGKLQLGVAVANAARTAKAKAAAVKLGADPANPCPYGAFDNGHVSTEGKVTFRYGLVAVRMKFPAAQGQHGAAWLQSVAGGVDEIDFLESFGLGKGIQYKLHLYQPDGTKISSGGYIKSIPEVKTAAWWDQYHVVTLEWTQNQYIFTVDGKETFRTSEGISQTDKFLILSLLTSDWELPAMNAKGLPDSMPVDWVRVWQK